MPQFPPGGLCLVVWGLVTVTLWGPPSGKFLHPMWMARDLVTRRVTQVENLHPQGDHHTYADGAAVSRLDPGSHCHGLQWGQ